MECDNCHSKTARALNYYFGGGKKFCSCDQCGNVSTSIRNPDIYWEGPGYNRGICDDNGRPIFLESKSQKVRLMKEKGLREAGDMWRGTRGTEFQKVESIKQDRLKEHKEQVKNAGRIFREGLRKLRHT
jgi:hypothetical protein